MSINVDILTRSVVCAMYICHYDSVAPSVGVERLAGMSLHDPVRIDITQPSLHDTGHVTEPEQCSDNGVKKDSVPANFAVPESLQHEFVVVPHKLRLVSLAAFILSKSQVYILY